MQITETGQYLLGKISIYILLVTLFLWQYGVWSYILVFTFAIPFGPLHTKKISLPKPYYKIIIIEAIVIALLGVRLISFAVPIPLWLSIPPFIWSLITVRDSGQGGGT